VTAVCGACLVLLPLACKGTSTDTARESDTPHDDSETLDTSAPYSQDTDSGVDTAQPWGGEVYDVSDLAHATYGGNDACSAIYDVQPFGDLLALSCSNAVFVDPASGDEAGRLDVYSVGSYTAARAPGADIDGDGWLDLTLMGADPVGAHIFWGPLTGVSDVTAVERLTLAESMDGDWTGYSSAVVQGDGSVMQWLVGAPHYDNYDGRVLVFDAGERWKALDPGDAVATITGPSFSYTGSYLADASDMDGDGISDVIAGGGGYESGLWSLYSGPVLGTLDYNDGHSWMVGAGSYPYSKTAGGPLGTGGDLDGDGYADALIGGTTEHDDGQTAVACVFTGSANERGSVPDCRAQVNAGPRLDSGADYDLFSDLELADHTGDGQAELVLYASGAGTGEGAVYLVAGPLTGVHELPDAAVAAIAAGAGYTGESMATSLPYMGLISHPPDEPGILYLVDFSDLWGE